MRLFYSTPSQRAASGASQGTGGAISECPRTARVRSSEIPFLSCTRHAEFKFRILTAVAGALDWPRLSCTKTESQGDKFQSQAANKGRRGDQGATGGADGGRRRSGVRRRRSPTERRAPTEVADGGRCAESGSPNLDSSQHRSVPACPANPQPGRARLLVLSLRPGRLYRHSRARNAHLIDGRGRGRSTARCFCLCFLVIL